MEFTKTKPCCFNKQIICLGVIGMANAPPFFQDYVLIVYVFYVFVKRQKQPPGDLTVSLGGLFFAFPEQIFFVAVHLVLFFFGQALALFAGLV